MSYNKTISDAVNTTNETDEFQWNMAGTSRLWVSAQMSRPTGNWVVHARRINEFLSNSVVQQEVQVRAGATPTVFPTQLDTVSNAFRQVQPVDFVTRIPEIKKSIAIRV